MQPDDGPVQLTVRANAGLRIFCLLGVLVSLSFVLGLAPQLHPAHEVAQAAVAGGIVGIVPLLLGTSTVRVHGDRLQVANWLLVSEVAVADVAYLDHRNGFEVVLCSGYRIDFVGSAPSLIGMVSRYWSARRMIATIEASLGRPLSAPTAWQPGEYPVSRRLRTDALLACAAYMVIGVGAALLLAA